jgi:hypothetical protein
MLNMPSLFDTPFKPMTADDDGFNVDLAPLLVFDKAIVLGKNSKFYVDEDVVDSSDEDESLKRDQEYFKAKDEQARNKRISKINKDKLKEDTSPRRAEELRLKKLNKEITDNYLSLGGSEKDLQFCKKCQVKKIKNEENFDKLSTNTAEYKRGYRFECTCIDCKTESQEYKHDKYLEYRALEFNKFTCDCGECFMISKNSTRAKEQITKHSQSRHHKMFEMVKSDNIKYELFNIGQLRAINKNNLKEDGSYIISNIPNKKKDQIVKELTEYEGIIEIPDNILSIQK